MTDPVVMIHVHPLSEVRQRLSGILARFRREGAAAAYVDGEISAAELYRRTVARYRQP